MTTLILATISFIATHFLLSHPFRPSLVRHVGEATFQGIFSLVAVATISWMGLAYRAAPSTSLLWPVGEGTWAVVTAVMLLASVLFMGSLIRNPALPTGGARAKFPDTAKGVFAITRHPMMWAFALWGLCHIAVYPVTKNIVVALAIMFLALVGAALQDHKKERLEPELWPAWEKKTSYVPFAAIASNRAQLHGLGIQPIAGGLALWLAASWAHIPLSGWAAGVWRWLH